MKKIIWLFLGLILLASLILAVFIFWPKLTKTTLVKESTFSQQLTPVLPGIDQERAMTKVIGAAGGVVFTRTASGMLVSLTVPPDALVLDTEISIAPLKSLPVSGYERADIGFGVIVEPRDNFLQKPAYLSFVPNTEIPNFDETKRVPWDRCNIGSVGFDPNICAGLNKYAFGYGVNPGEVVIFANHEDKYLRLMPTVPIGDKKSYNSQIWRGGLYFADKVNQSEIKTLLDVTLKDSDFEHEVEGLSHLASFGGDLNPYLEIIGDFDRSSSSFPRDIAKSIFIANQAGQNEIVRQKIDEFKHEYDVNFEYVRSSYLPWPNYYALLEQLVAQLKPAPQKTSHKTKSALAKTPKPNDSSGIEALSRELENQMRRAKEHIERTFGSDELSDYEKLDAVETAVEAGLMGFPEFKALSERVIEDATNASNDLNELGRIKYVAHKAGFTDLQVKAMEKAVGIMQEKAAEMDKEACDLTKKNLKNFGMSDCL